MESMNGIQPMYDLADKNNNEWGSGNWIWIILLFLLFGGNWGNNGNLQSDALMNQEFIKRDLFSTNQNVSSQGFQNSRDILESRYTTQLGLQNLGQQNQECCCATKRAIDGVNTQSFKNTCDITTAIHSEGEATRALINANTMQELRDKLADRDRDLLTANFQLSQQAQSANIINTLQPTPKPAYITCSPYYAYNNMTGCGCNQIQLERDQAIAFGLQGSRKATHFFIGGKEK